MEEHYRANPDAGKDQQDYVPSSTDALYLYGRSFFLKDKPVAKNHEATVEFFLGQAREHWLKTGLPPNARATSPSP